jgi:hypothetical protein
LTNQGDFELIIFFPSLFRTQLKFEDNLVSVSHETMTTYVLTVRPCVEILAITAAGESIVLRSRSELLSTLNNPRTLASDTDLLDAVSTISADALEMIRGLNRGRSRWSTLLFLMSSAGIIIYLLCKKSHEPAKVVRKGIKKSRWKARDWFWWIFGDDDISYNQSLALQSDYFGPSTVRRASDIRTSKEISPLIAPCPNCVRGICKVKKHQQIYLHFEKSNTTPSSSILNVNNNLSGLILPPTSTPESADDEAEVSDREENAQNAQLYSIRMQRFHSRFFRPSPDRLGTRLQGDGSPYLPQSKQNLYAMKLPQSAKSLSSRNGPVGQELFNYDLPRCQVSRDISVESDLSGSSMRGLIQDAREIRRLIREASMDSLASDLSLELRENGAAASADFRFSNLQTELSELKKNCSLVNDKLDNVPPANLVTSRPTYGISSDASSEHSGKSMSGSRSPDPTWLRRSRVHFWKFHFNNGNSDHESVTNEESLEWDSPVQGWHDLKKSKYKVALSSQNTSEFGGDDINDEISEDLDCWEWDSDGFGLQVANETEGFPLELLKKHGTWLPENSEKLELDMEMELGSQISGSFNSRNGSRRGSSEWNWYANKVRLPPSGRSSVDKGSGDTPRQSIDRAQLIKSFGVIPEKQQNCSKLSEESGFQDLHCSSSLFSTSGLILSPVHETKEPLSSNTATPVKGKGSFKVIKTCEENKEEVLQVLQQ